MEKERSHASGFSAIGVTAILSVVILMAATGLQIRGAIQSKDAETSYTAADITKDVEATDANLLSGLGIGETSLGASILGEVVSRYASLQEEGLYTEEAGQEAAEKMAIAILPEVPYISYTSSDIKTDPNTSPERSLAYRSDLQKSLAPLLKNTQAEIEIFAYYVETKDTKYLTQLKDVAQNYRAAAGASAGVVVPADALTQHIAILNAMQEFAAMLDAMVANASDPLASVALLRTYNQAEADMVQSFDSLATYYKQKNT